MQKSAKEIHILLADDHNVMRAGLKLLLESHTGFKVVSEASDGNQAVENALRTRPEVVVLDIAMPKLSGIEAAQRISAQLPQTAIIILSMHSDEGYVLRALKSGARGYLLKDSAESDLIQAIKAVSEGKAFFSPEISKVLAEDYVREINIRGAEDSYDLLSRHRRLAQPEPLYRRNPSPESSKQAEPSQLPGIDPLRCAKGHHLLICRS